MGRQAKTLPFVQPKPLPARSIGIHRQREKAMADDKQKRDFHDRDRVSGGEEYEVEYFAKKHNLSPDQVRELIKQHGNDREALEAAAAHMSRDKSASRH
jgi:hypothetical protein